MVPKNLSNLIDVDVLITILRLAFYNTEAAGPGLTITYIEILKHLNLASTINKDRIKEALLTLLEAPFNTDGLEETPLISNLYFLENGAGVTIYFHAKMYLALKRGYFFDGLDYMPVQAVNNKEDRATV